MGKSGRRQAAEALRRQQQAEARRKKIVFGIAIGAAVVLIGGLLGFGIWMNRETEYEVNEPAAVTTDAQDPTAANGLLDYILTDAGQQIFADYGYRPVTQSVLQQNADKFPEVPGLFTIQEFGGWGVVDDKFFDDETGSVIQILKQQGAPLE